MAKEQASNISENIPKKETHGNHFERLVAVTVKPSFQIPTIQVTIDHEEEIEEFQILNHAINASDQFGNNPIINVGNMVNNSTINLKKKSLRGEMVWQLDWSPWKVTTRTGNLWRLVEVTEISRYVYSP
ncbi:hypothetical protein LWI29_029006 [Acer saccharum]|uniref:Uncharacterized protein n=1 Tax=Acer saccharum TaxID=4024 RepID=A0AA39VPC5_ACESA|nr:hypothetical protein LWI29_029006 [Acer saccharum]